MFKSVAQKLIACEGYYSSLNFVPMLVTASDVENIQSQRIEKLTSL